MKSEYKIVAGIGVVMCLLVILISYPIAKVVMDDKERLAYGIKRIVEEEEIECKAVFVSGDLHNQLNQLGLEPVMTYRKKDARKVLELRVESVFTGDDFEGIKIVEEEDRYILTYPKENNMLDYQNIKMESMEIPKASKEDKIKITQLFEGGMGDVECKRNVAIETRGNSVASFKIKVDCYSLAFSKADMVKKIERLLKAYNQVEGEEVNMEVDYIKEKILDGLEGVKEVRVDFYMDRQNDIRQIGLVIEDDNEAEKIMINFF